MFQFSPLNFFHLKKGSYRSLHLYLTGLVKSIGSCSKNILKNEIYFFAMAICTVKLFAGDIAQQFRPKQKNLSFT